MLHRNYPAPLFLSLLLSGCGHASPPPAPKQSPATPASASAPATSQPAAEPTTESAEDTTLEDKLIGTWVAPDVDVKLGQVKIQLTFKKQDKVHLAAWSDIPFVGQIRNKTGPYQVHGHILSSRAIRDGTSVQFWFDHGQLVIKTPKGKVVHFTRQ